MKTLKLKISHLQSRLINLGLPDYTVFVIISIITGAASGTIAVLFHEAIDLVEHFLFGNEGHNYTFFRNIYIIFIPALGMLLLSLLIKLFPKVAKKKGVLEVIKSVATRGGMIKFRTTVFHFFAPVICIGSGCPVGPEGPAAQIGGGIASKIGSIFGLSDTRRRMFTAAGAGAAIAAIFRTPMGGVFFALEVILLNDFQAPVFSALVLASVTASAISQIILGDKPVFFFENIEIGPYSEFYLYAVAGLIAGGLSILFIKYSVFVKEFFRKGRVSSLAKWKIMGSVGLLIGVCILFFPEILGIGYNSINSILKQDFSWQLVSVIFLLKFALVPIVLYAGGFGGLFAPSLFMGAGFGFLFCVFFNQVFGFNLDPTSYTLISMGAFLGAINSIPISAILIIFEMTQDYSFILPLMLSVVAGTTITQIFLKGSIYAKNLEEQGYHITQGHDTDVLRSLRVKDVMRNDIVLIPENETLPVLMSKVSESPHSTFYTINNDGELTGTIIESELRPLITEYENLREMVVAGDIAKPGTVVVRENDDLDFVLKLFGGENIDEFPVVSEEDEDKITGSITYHDVISAYNKESLKHRIADGLLHDFKALEKFSSVKVADDYLISELMASKIFVGKTLSELRLRNKYGIEVLMIKPHNPPFMSEEKATKFIVPKHDYRIRANDILIVFGKEAAINNFQNL